MTTATPMVSYSAASDTLWSIAERNVTNGYKTDKNLGQTFRKFALNPFLGSTFDSELRRHKSTKKPLFQTPLVVVILANIDYLQGLLFCSIIGVHSATTLPIKVAYDVCCTL